MNQSFAYHSYSIHNHKGQCVSANLNYLRRSAIFVKNTEIIIWSSEMSLNFEISQILILKTLFSWYQIQSQLTLKHITRFQHFPLAAHVLHRSPFASLQTPSLLSLPPALSASFPLVIHHLWDGPYTLMLQRMHRWRKFRWWKRTITTPDPFLLWFEVTTKVQKYEAIHNYDNQGQYMCHDCNRIHSVQLMYNIVSDDSYFSIMPFVHCPLSINKAINQHLHHKHHLIA